jgi:hypothetical protein
MIGGMMNKPPDMADVPPHWILPLFALMRSTAALMSGTRK